MKTIIILILTLISLHSFSQKAFEYEYYYGKTKKFEIKLSLSNGYIMGSEIIKTNVSTKKKVKYKAENGPVSSTQHMTFFPVRDGADVLRKRDNFVLYQMKDEYEVLPDKIRGVYHLDLGGYSFTLLKQKN